MKGDLDVDSRGLFYEAYRIEGITAPDCRAIFFDWALGLPAELDPNAALRKALDHYAATYPDHPMTAVMREGLDRPAPTGRRRRRG